MNHLTEESYAPWARSHHIPIASEATREYLEQELAVYRPRCVVEIWAAVAHTSCRLGKKIAPRQGKVYACELSYPTYHLARWRRNKTQCRNVHLLHADIITLPLQRWLPEPVDFVFIDGMKKQYALYLELIRPYCRTGACLFFDDVRAYADKMDPLRDFLLKEHIASTLVDLADGDAILKVIV